MLKELLIVTMALGPVGPLAAKVSKAKLTKVVLHEYWVCPMHDGGEGEHAGPCPKCGMPMVKDKQLATVKATPKAAKPAYQIKK